MATIEQIIEVYNTKGLNGFRIDLEGAKKAYSYGIRFINVEVNLGTDTSGPEGPGGVPNWKRLNVKHDLVSMGYPIYENQRFDGARISFRDKGHSFSKACELIRIIATSLIRNVPLTEETMFLNGKIKSEGVHLNFIQHNGKDGQPFNDPIVRITIPFKKDGGAGRINTTCKSKALLVEEKKGKLITYGQVNEIFPPNSKISALISLGTVVLSSQGLHQRCEFVALSNKGRADQGAAPLSTIPIDMDMDELVEILN